VGGNRGWQRPLHAQDMEAEDASRRIHSVVCPLEVKLSRVSCGHVAPLGHLAGFPSLWLEKVLLLFKISCCI